MSQYTLQRLRELKLSGMATNLEQQLAQPGPYDGLSFTDRLTLMLDQECLSREQRKQNRLVKQAKFKLHANLQSLDYGGRRGLDKAQVAQLTKTDWLVRAHNLLITGPCGSGKTYLACALGHQACLNGESVRYYRLSRLFESLTQAKADGSYSKQLAALAKVKLLILDDWGLEVLSDPQRHDLMEIMDDRYGHSSTLMISQLPTGEWYNAVGENTLADAILDRLMHNAYRINLQGESMRKRQANLTEGEQSV